MDLVVSKIAPFARTAALLALGRIVHGRLTVVEKDAVGKAEPLVFGQDVSDSNVLEATLVVKDEIFWTKFCLNVDAAMCECYTTGQIECSDLLTFLTIYLQNTELLGNGISGILLPFTRVYDRFFGPSNDAVTVQKSCEYAYDISNEFYAGWLSKEMQYCCPIFSDDPKSDTLEAAQQRKAHMMIKRADIRSTDHVLDIGAGWGYLAMEMARTTGCRVTAITLSVQQKAWAEARIKEAGLNDKIRFLLCDYRNTPRPEGGYDKIVSMAMYEHVGKDNLNTYFGSISQLLKPSGGIMVVDGTTIKAGSHEKPINLSNFLCRYVFPGLYTPTIQDLFTAIDMGSKGTLEVDMVDSIGPHYALAWVIWRENLLKNWDTLRKSYAKGMGIVSDRELEEVKRRWIYVFTYFEASVREGHVGDHIITAVRTPAPWPSKLQL